MKKTGLLLICVVAFSLSHAQISNTFDTDANGWTFSDNNLNDPQTVNYNASGGNPGGYISATKTSTSQPYYWTSPAQFGGNLMYFSYGQSLSFDIQLNYVGSFHFSTGDVQIISPSAGTLVYALPTIPAQAPAWSSYTIALDETAGWRIGSTGGPLATKAQILQYLSGVASFRIAANYRSGVTTFTTAIDNVVLGQRTILPAPAVTSLSTTSGNAGSSVTINGNGFDPTPANNAVYFGGVQATITSTSATALTVTIPNSAQYGPITVVNKTTGLSMQSPQPFVPTFSGGGRIIPASFDPKIDFMHSSDVTSVNVADIDGDGWNDLLVSGSANNVSIFLNLGTGGDITTGSFASPVILPNAGNTRSLHIRDVDADGKVDIISGYTSGSIVNFATFRNTSTPGNLSFEAVEYWPGLVYSGFNPTIVDVDGDGLVDLVGQHGNGSVNVDFWIAQNISTSGNIEFGPSISYFGGSALDAGSGACAGDLDNDGKPEFLVSHGFGGSFSILKNNSVPGTIALTNLGTITSGNNALSIADFNQDGKNDIAWKSGSTVRIRVNTNAGGPLDLTDFTTEVILTGDLSNYGGISIGDFNGDGKIDIAASDNGDVGVFENAYTGGVFDANSFVGAYRMQGSGGSTYPTSPVLGNLNGDNKPELIVGVTNTTPNRISIYENNNIHTPVISLTTVSPLKGAVGSTVTITGDYFSTTAAENIVHFGAVQATVVTATKTQLTVTVPAGAGYAPVRVTRDQFTASYHLPFSTTFSSGVSFNNTHFAPPVSFTLTGGDYDINVADLNGDGMPDILAEANTNKVYAFRNTHTTGAISATSLIADDSITTGTMQNPRIIDLNGDNKPDFVATSGVFRNISAGAEINFEAQTNIGGTLTAAPADFNLDGKIDYVGTLGSSTVSVFENRMRQGASAFISGGSYNSISTNFDFVKPAASGGPVTADFDNDGLMDMACGNGTTDNLTVWKNNGSYRIGAASFTSIGNLTTLDNPGRLYTGDMDVDGKVDIVLYYGTGTTSSQISVFHNTSSVGSISFNRVDYAIPAAVTLPWVSDLDGDGKPEILVTSETTNQFFILKNTSTPGTMNASSFAAPFATAVTGPRGLATADINLDGKPEIIINTNANTLLVYENLVPSVAITITQQPTSPNYACENASASFTTAAIGTTNITYQWQKYDGSAFVNLANNTTFSGVTTATLLVSNISSSEAGDYQCVISGDLAPSVITNTANLVFNSLPTPPDAVNGISCGPGAVTLTASGGSPGNYQWYTTSPLTAISGATNDAFTTPSLNANTDYAVTLRNTFCESIPVTVTAIISTPPARPNISSSITPVGNELTICSTTSLTLTAPNGFPGYLWSDGSTTPSISVTASGTYSVTVINGNGCPSPASDGLVITIVPAPCTNSAPVISSTTVNTTVGNSAVIDLSTLISDADNNLVLSSLTITQQPASGAVATISGTTLTINYSGISFSGLETVTIGVCDVFGECTTQQFEITVIGELEIFNAVSPNNDSKNEIFRIEYIDLIPETQTNTVTIYNRWGDVVFEVSNYNNADRAFKGVSDNGKDLPSGTYFYKIEFQSGMEAKTGFLSLKR